MSETSARKVDQKKDWTLTPRAFHELVNWLDEGANSEGGKYVAMRNRLASYFNRKHCFEPEQLADETLNRVARRLSEENTVDSDTPAAKYCYIVARYVFLEYLRESEKTRVLSVDVRQQQDRSNFSVSNRSLEEETQEKRLKCLDHCTEKLDSPSRDLIFGYYTGKKEIKIESRRDLADRLGISMNALCVRACRIRNKIEDCVRRCVVTE